MTHRFCMFHRIDSIFIYKDNDICFKLKLNSITFVLFKKKYHQRSYAYQMFLEWTSMFVDHALSSSLSWMSLSQQKMEVALELYGIDSIEENERI